MNNNYNFYNADLKIEVENQFLYSAVTVNYKCNLSSTKVLNFYIYKDIQIENVTCDKKMRYEVGSEKIQWSPFVLESKLIKLLFDEPIYENEIININFKYKGHINLVTQYGINRLTKDWIELGIYTPWFPLSKKLEQALFNVKVQISDGYRIINSKDIGEYSIINQLIPNSDCPIIASKEFKCVKCNIENIDVNVYFIDNKYNDLAQKISDYSIIILNYYKRFGPIDSQEISIVIAPRKDGGGYCSPGLIVITPDYNNKDEVGYFKFIAHELAHLWWCKVKNPDTWEDWLNESFAEFSALLALRDAFGVEEFNNRINTYSQEAKKLPPIRDIDRKNDKAHQVLYKKGPLILNELKKNIGELKFEKLLNIVHTSNTDTTEKFLDKLIEITNQEKGDYFINLLIQ
ncbi:M1 family aminopeptidase [Candidatus Clostridium radicumherbarum]|uniref:M1 family aminopeptidase n=1 Tax=Candidatus Clostridium radicumherbarum TaxID=3381662 RepID=A0ABW8TNW3_9CLOT